MPDPVQWCVVVPVKELHLAKSRLEPLAGALRAELALAMASDVVAAAVAATAVEAVVVVTNDVRAGVELGALGAHVVADGPASGIDDALVDAARHAAFLWPRCGIAALSSDVPCVTPTQLDEALRRAASYERALVADHRDDGTTLLTARPGIALAPRYGVASRARHVSSGAHQVEADDLPGLRLDVDTKADLLAAGSLGVGPRTAAVMAVMLRPDHG